MAGILYIVGTPIGNLSDFSKRGIETLKVVDLVLAEDTRVSIKLLNHFEIKTALKSFHQHNERDEEQRVLKRLKEGEDIAIISDAGMPGISDPGGMLVKACHEQGIEIQSVPGPSAVITALAASGQNTDRFYFHGFLPKNKRAKKSELEAIKNFTSTIIFYASPHELLGTLKIMLEVLGNRSISVSRELTKKFEENVHTDLESAIITYETSSPRGEFVLVLEGAAEVLGEQMSFESAILEVEKLLKSGEKLADATKEIALSSGHSKRELYNFILKNKDEN